FLGNPEVRGVEDSPVGAIPHHCEALLNRSESCPAIVSKKAQDILHDEHAWLKVIHVKRKLLEKIVARVFIIRRSEGPQRRKALAGRTADDDVNPLPLNQALDMRRLDKANVVPNYPAVGVIGLRGGSWIHLDINCCKQLEPTVEGRETMAESAGSAKQINYAVNTFALSVGD
ncbi:MAG TPA: hypothetical protein VFV90_10580, partial [Usitatibacter sp.]|nr:hypothetical protein [Usitatibacter sp.]